MIFEDLVRLYDEKKRKFGIETYKHVSELLREAKELHRKDFLRHPTPQGDHEQSWRSFKGKNLEKLIAYIIKDEVMSLGLKMANGNVLERTKSENLPLELSKVKRNLSVD
jgi:type II restriction enzyme